MADRLAVDTVICRCEDTNVQHPFALDDLANVFLLF